MSKNTQISELINYISVNEIGNVVFTTVPAATTNTDKFLVSDSGVLKFRTATQLLSDIGAQASGSYQAALSGTGFVKISGSTISYDNSTYLTTSSASSTYLPLSGGTLTGPLNGTSASFSGDVIRTSSNVDGMNEIAVINTATSGASSSRVRISTAYNGGTTLGDALTQYTDNNNFNWATGSGVTTSRDFVITNYFTLGTSVFFRLAASTGAATFSSTISTTGLTTGTTGGSTISITTSNNAGTTGSPLQTKINFLGYNGNINGQIRVDDVSSTAQVGSMQFYTWNSAQVLALTLAHTGAATFSSTVRTGGVSIGVAATANVLDVRGENNTFDGTIVIGARGTLQHRDAGQTITSLANDYNDNAAKMEFRMKGNTSANSVLTLLGSGAATFSSTVNTVGLLTGQSSIYQSDAGGLIASNRWGVYNGGATAMRFLYNPSGDVIWDNGNAKMTLTSGGNLLVGTTTDSGYKIDVQQGASNAAKFNFVVTGAWGGGANQDHGMLISGARHSSDTNTSLLHILNLDTTSLFRVTDYGKVGIGISNPTDKVDIQGGNIKQLSSTLDSTAKYATKIIHTGSAFDNPLVSIYTAGNGTNAVAILKITVYQTAFGSENGNIQIGYAKLMGQNASGTVTAMTVEYNGGIGGVGTLSWSGHTLQYQTNRASNYDSYTIKVELAGSLGTSSF